jgi:hypothetical protein
MTSKIVTPNANELKAMSLQSPPGRSPWGVIWGTAKMAEGIYTVNTESHGGFWLSPVRNAEFVQKFPTFDPFAGHPWFEEDCDWAAVVVAFASEFPDEAVWDAVRYVASVTQKRNSPRSAWLDVRDHLTKDAEGIAACKRGVEWYQRSVAAGKGGAA